MSFELPEWMRAWLGLTPSSNEESIVARLEFLRPLGSTVAVLFVMAIAAITIRAYLGAEGGTRLRRAVMAGLRLLACLMLLAMIGELSLSLRRAGLPYLVALLDDSESMTIVDRYADEKVRRDVEARMKRSAAATSLSEGAQSPPASRANLLKGLLLENDGEFLRRPSEKNYRLQAFTVSDTARRLPDDLPELRKAVGELVSRGPSTRLGDGLRTAIDELRGRPVAAVVLFSDGVNTAGQALVEAATAAAERNTPVYAVGFGETKKAVDVEVAELKVRDRVTIDDPVSFDFNVIARGAEGRKIEVSLRTADDSTVLAKKTVVLGPDDAGQAVRLMHRPEKVGTFRFLVEAEPLPDEAGAETTSNNRAEATVEVRTNVLSVLLVESYPSFEFRYLRQMLGRDATVKLSCVLQEADAEYSRTDPSVTSVFPVTLDELLKYDVILFGDVDPAFLGASAITALRDFVLLRGRGVVFAAGPRFLPQAYRNTPLADLLPLDWNKPPTGTKPTRSKSASIRLTPAAVEEPIFQLADDDGDAKPIWQNLPGLYWIWPADVRLSAEVMVETIEPVGEAGPLPVIVRQRAGRGIVLYHATDETWRWRFRTGDAYFGRYWIQAIRYLCAHHDGARPATLRVAADRYDLGKPVAVEVRYQDERYVPPTGDVTAVLEAEGQPTRTITLSPRRNLRTLYEANLSGLSEGKYRVTLGEASLVAGPAGDPADGKLPTDEFVVAAAQAESFPIEANFEALKAAVARSGGAFFTPADAHQLFDKLPRGKLSPTEPLPPIPLWNAWYTLAVLLLFLVTEWVLRKRQGLV